MSSSRLIWDRFKTYETLSALAFAGVLMYVYFEAYLFKQQGCGKDSDYNNPSALVKTLTIADTTVALGSLLNNLFTLVMQRLYINNEARSNPNLSNPEILEANVQHAQNAGLFMKLCAVSSLCSLASVITSWASGATLSLVSKMSNPVFNFATRFFSVSFRREVMAQVIAPDQYRPLEEGNGRNEVQPGRN